MRQLQDGAAPGGRFDLVMANILRGPLLELQPRLTGYCRPEGRLVLSGILQEQVCVVVVGLLAVSRVRARVGCRPCRLTSVVFTVVRAGAGCHGGLWSLL